MPETMLVEVEFLLMLPYTDVLLHLQDFALQPIHFGVSLSRVTFKLKDGQHLPTLLLELSFVSGNQLLMVLLLSH